MAVGQHFVLVKKFIERFAPDVARTTKSSLLADVSAGVTVGIVALPLSLALAIAVGVPPILGLYTAAIAGFLAALCAGSPFSVSGPAAAMVPILAAVIQKHGLSELPYITILAALFLLTFALLGLGKFIRKVPEPVVLGFTLGVALVIFASQLNTFLGLSGLHKHESFAANSLETITHLTTLHLPTILLGLLALGIITTFHRLPVVGKIPATLVAVVATALLAGLVPFFNSTLTLGELYGALPLGMPAFTGFSLQFSHLLNVNLWVPALEIAGLIAIESLLCAMVADRLTKTHHNSNQELFAQGIANLGSALFGAIPATGVIARTGTIIKNGAKSRLASLIHALVVIAFIVALAPLAAHIPLATLSAVLLVTAVKIAELKELKHFVLKENWRLSAVLAVTAGFTIFIDLIAGVGLGLLTYAVLCVLPKFKAPTLRIGRRLAHAYAKYKP